MDILDAADILPSQERSAEAVLLSREKALRVAKAVETLSPRQRSVFLLRFVEEMEPSEIAQASGMPVNTVKTHLLRALKTVREHVKVQAT